LGRPLGEPPGVEHEAVPGRLPVVGEVDDAAGSAPAATTLSAHHLKEPDSWVTVAGRRLTRHSA